MKTTIDSKMILTAVLAACCGLSSCSDNPREDIKTTLNIFMPDTSSMNVSRFRKETAPLTTVGYQYADDGPPKKLPMRPQSTRLANSAIANSNYANGDFPAAPK